MEKEYAEKLYEEMSAMISHVSESMGKCRFHCMNKYNSTVNAVAGDILVCLGLEADEETLPVMYDMFSKNVEFEDVLVELEIDVE